MSLLAVDGISKRFRGLQAVKSVSFEVPERAIVALIGPNGAGKTTVFNMVAGVFPPDEGRISLAGASIGGLRADQVCRAGVSRTFQLVRPFSELTVEDNVVVGALNRSPNVEAARAEARAILARLDLAAKAPMRAASLTLPDRKRLEVARALATGPRLLLLDEVMAGLNPTELAGIIDLIRRLHGEGLSLIIIEHIMAAMMRLARRIVVLHHGERIAEGTPEEVTRDRRVVDAYLGEEFVLADA